MPDPSQYWLVAFRPDSDNPLEEINEKVSASGGLSKIPGTGLGKNEVSAIGELRLPEFKTAPLSTLISLSESLAKQDPISTASVAKILETLRNLSGSTPNEMEENLQMDDGRSFEQYLCDGWEWNKGKYRVESRKLEEIVDGLVKELAGIDNVHKQKLANYNSAKGQLQQLQRKKTGSLAVRNLGDVVSASDFVDQSSEHLETLLVAVPKTSSKEWTTSYERLAPFIVPRSSSKLAEDEEFALFNVTLFRRSKDDFTQKCREKKFAVREFEYDAGALAKGQKEMEELEKSEKELWTDLLRLSRINLSEAFSALIHLKVVRTYIECLLRYGLPSHYFATILKPEPKQSKRLLTSLTSYYDSLDTSEKKSKKKGKGDRFGGATDEELVGEYAGLMEQEVFGFVLFECMDPRNSGGIRRVGKADSSRSPFCLMQIKIFFGSMRKRSPSAANLLET